MTKKEHIYIFDTTLRDGEQALPASLSVDQKVRIARQLAKLKVDIIEAGFPVSSPGDYNAVKKIASSVKGPVICGLARTVKKDIQICAAALKPASRFRIHTFIGTSAIHAEKKLRKSDEEILEIASESIKYARKYCGDVEFSPEDAARTEPDFLCRIVETAIKLGASTINIPDTVGYTTPEAFGGIISDLFERVPNIDKAVISVHCHNDLGMATANSLTAVSHGARQIECAVNGLGERAGNAALEEVVMSLKVRRKLFNAETGVNTKEITRTSKLVSDICNMPVQPNKAVVGSNAFSHSSGIHQDGILKAKKTYEIMTPASVGLSQHKMNLTSRSGRHIVKARLKALGYAENEININTFYKRFLKLADKKGTVYDDDLITLMETKDTGKVQNIFKLDYLNVSCGTSSVPTATVILKSGKKSFQQAACGDGAVDAATNAIDKITGYDDIKIDEFHLDSITEGKNALGKVKITARSSVGVYTGKGTSTDIVEASVNAYMDVVNKIARMKKFGKKI